MIINACTICLRDDVLVEEGAAIDLVGEDSLARYGSVSDHFGTLISIKVRGLALAREFECRLSLIAARLSEDLGG